MKKLALAVSLALSFGVAQAQDKTIKISGFGAKTGPVRSFGVNSEAAMLAAADVINKAGGVKLADGTKAKIASLSSPRASMATESDETFHSITGWPGAGASSARRYSAATGDLFCRWMVKRFWMRSFSIV